MATGESRFDPREQRASQTPPRHFRFDRFARFLLPIAIFALNAWLIRELFYLTYSPYLGSIETTYFALVRDLVAHWPDVAWYPYWYTGVPFEHAYLPLLNYAVALWLWLTRAEPALAYHQFVAVVYCLAPVTLYLLAVRLGATRTASGVAAVLYSLAAPSAMLIEQVRLDLGTIWRPHRYQILLAYGEGPHEMSLMLLPLAILALDRALERHSAQRIAIAAVAVASVAATNWLGSFSLALSVVCLWFTRGLDRKRLLVSAAVGVFAYALVCVLIPLSHILTIQTNSARLTSYSSGRTLVPAFAAALVLLYIVRRAGGRFKLTPAAQFFLSCAVLFTPVVLGDFWYGKQVLPQPGRYQLEMDSALVFALALSIAGMVRMLPRVARAVVAVGLAAFAAHQIGATREWVAPATRETPIQNTIEYRTAMWCREHCSDGRIFLSGSTEYWLNVWTDAAQLEGNFNNGILNWNAAYAEEAAWTGSAEDTLLWFKALGVRRAEMVGGHSANWYHYMSNPGKLSGLLPVERREPDDTIYRIPIPVTGLAHRIARNALVQRAPRGPQDTGALRNYVAALESEQPGGIDMRWTSRHSFEVKATLEPGQVISIQEAWHSGWSASAGGRPVALWRDGLGFMAAAPDCSGPCIVKFEFTRSIAATAVTTIGWVLFGLCLAIRPRGRRPFR
jgi:hypothetical protein